MNWNSPFNTPFFTNDIFSTRNPRFPFTQNNPFFQQHFGIRTTGRVPQNVSSPHIEALDEEEEDPQLMRGRSRGRPIVINGEEDAHSRPTSDEDKELDDAIRQSLEEKKREKQGQSHQQTKHSKFTVTPTSNTHRKSGSYTVQEIEEEDDTSTNSEMDHNMDIDEEEQIQKALKQSAELHKYEQERKRFEQERLLREQQEREYAESLKIDQEKEKLRLQKERLGIQKKNQEQEMKEHEESAELLAAMQLSEDLSVKSRLMKQLKAEPAATEQNIAQIIYRLPNGDKIQRRFYQNEKVEVLFKFLESRTEEQVPKNFELVINYPRKVFSKTEKMGLNVTLNEAKLVPQAVLFVKELAQ